jgi:hypothetical protein
MAILFANPDSEYQHNSEIRLPDTLKIVAPPHHSQIASPNGYFIRKSRFRIPAPFGNQIAGYPENRGAAAPFGNRFSEWLFYSQIPVPNTSGIRKSYSRIP